MRICIDASPTVHGRAGIGRYVHELTTSLLNHDMTNEYAIFYNRSGEARVPASLERLARVTSPVSDKPWRLRVLLAHLMHLSQDRLFPGVDLFHATDNLLPRLTHSQSVLILYDLAFRLYPEAFTRLNRWFQALTMGMFLRTADAVMAISESTKKDAMRLYGIDESRLTVVYGGVNPRFQPASPGEVASTRSRYGLPEHYILFVGSIEPRKNLSTLLTAFSALKQQSPEADSLKLVAAGKKGWIYAGFFQRLRELGLEEEVVLPGFVADEDLPALYTASDLFVFPSWYEGFGLPVLEAMACGAPVVCSNAASLPEVAGDAALLVSPDDVRGLREAISRALTDLTLRNELIERGFRQAARFTWERAAQQTLAIYENVAMQRGQKP